METILYNVLRQDGNGNTFIVQKDLTREEAEALVERFEQRHHQQMYWYQRSKSDAESPIT